MRLRGIIYGGQGHFTSRFVDVHGYMWFHDGITTGSTCLPEANLLSVSDPLSLCMSDTVVFRSNRHWV
ncbi:hypothetical protein B0H13DRAFT_1659253 [Mycena leptocephala]|nr:hypothetical protein B0H13DRAFT_1659253 [Mycena leptocephala]